MMWRSTTWGTLFPQPAATELHQPAMELTPPTSSNARKETSLAEEQLENTCKILDHKMEELHLTQRRLMDPYQTNATDLKQREHVLQSEMKSLLNAKEMWQSEIQKSQDPSFWTYAEPETYITAMHQKLHPELANNFVVNVDAPVLDTSGTHSTRPQKSQDDPISSTPVGKQSSRPSSIEVFQPPTPPPRTNKKLTSVKDVNSTHQVQPEDIVSMSAAHPADGIFSKNYPGDVRPKQKLDRPPRKDFRPHSKEGRRTDADIGPMVPETSRRDNHPDDGAHEAFRLRSSTPAVSSTLYNNELYNVDYVPNVDHGKSAIKQTKPKRLSEVSVHFRDDFAADSHNPYAAPNYSTSSHSKLPRDSKHN